MDPYAPAAAAPAGAWPCDVSWHAVVVVPFGLEHAARCEILAAALPSDVPPPNSTPAPPPFPDAAGQLQWLPAGAKRAWLDGTTTEVPVPVGCGAWSSGPVVWLQSVMRDNSRAMLDVSLLAFETRADPQRVMRLRLVEDVVAWVGSAIAPTAPDALPGCFTAVTTAALRTGRLPAAVTAWSRVHDRLRPRGSGSGSGSGSTAADVDDVDDVAVVMRGSAVRSRQCPGSYTSPAVAARVGEAFIDALASAAPGVRVGVNMVAYNTEVMAYVDAGCRVDVGLRLNLLPLANRHRRIGSHVTSILPGNLAYSLALYADVQPYDVVCDPVAGRAVVPLEALAAAGGRGVVLGGDQDAPSLADAVEVMAAGRVVVAAKPAVASVGGSGSGGTGAGAGAGAGTDATPSTTPGADGGGAASAGDGGSGVGATTAQPKRQRLTVAQGRHGGGVVRPFVESLPCLLPAHAHRRVDLYQWDAEALPLRAGSVDVFLLDPPFGMRHKMSGSLYPRMIRSMARCLRRPHGRVCILTPRPKAVDRVVAAAGMQVSKRSVVFNRGIRCWFMLLTFQADDVPNS